jgi:hypothetical protein
MALPATPATQAASATIASATLNNHRDNLNYLLAPPHCELRQTVAQSITTGTWTDITFDTEDVDSDGGHSTVTNTARYMATTAGWYLVSGAIDWAANASVVRRGARWAVNGTVINGSENVGPGSASQVCTAVARTIKVFLNGTTDYVTLQGFQDTGSSLNTAVAVGQQPTMSVLWVSS